MGSAKIHHRRFRSTDSFFKDALLLESTSTFCGPEGKDPYLICRRVDARQCSTAVSPKDVMMMEDWTKTVQSSPVKQRRSQSVIPSLSSLIGPGLQPPDSMQMTLCPSHDHSSPIPSRDGMLPPSRTAICEHRAVQFAPYITVRLYENVALGEEYLLSHGNSSSNGLPITLGNTYRTVREALPTVVVDSCASAAEIPPRLGYRRRFFESCRKLNRKERFAVLREKGGYSEKELWNLQRDLALKDRQIFFGVGGGQYFDKELWKTKREMALQNRHIFFFGGE